MAAALDANHDGNIDSDEISRAPQSLAGLDRNGDDPNAPTPHLDQLAKEGMELGRFHTYPVCSPSRAAFLTGMMPLRFGIVEALGPRQSGIPAGIPTLDRVPSIGSVPANKHCRGGGALGKERGSG